MSWQKIAEDARKAYCSEGPAQIYCELPDAFKEAWERAVRQAVWSYQMGMLKGDPELMVVLVSERSKDEDD